MRRGFLVTLGLWLTLAGCGRLGLTGTSSTYHLTITNPGTGDVEVKTSAGAVTCNTNPCEYDFPPNTPVTLTATDANLTFSQWTGSEKCDTSNPCEIVMTSDQTLGVSFIAHLSITLGGLTTGAAVAIDPGALTCPTDCEIDIEAGQVATLNAAAGTLLFAGWNGDCATFGESLECTITMDSNKTTTALFSDVDVTTFGTAGDDRIHAIAADPTTPNAFIVTGTFSADLNLDSQTQLQTVGTGQNMYVARFLGDTATWAYAFGGNGDAYPHAVHGRQNNQGELEVFVAGTLVGEIDLNLDGTPTDEPGIENGFVLKLNPTVDPDHPIWQRRYRDEDGAGDDGQTIVNDLTVVGNEVWVTGILVGDVDLGGQQKDTNQGNRTRMFIAEHDVDSGIAEKFYWTGEDANSHSEGAGISFYNDRMIVVGFNDSLLSGDNNMSFGGCSTNNSSGYDNFLFAFDTTNEVCVWSQPTTPPGGTQYSFSVAVDPTNGDNFGYVLNGTNLFPHRVDAGGNALWNGAFVIATGGLTTMPGVAWDAAHDELVIAGAFDTVLDVDGTMTDSSGGSDFFIVRMAPDGTFNDVAVLGGPGIEESGELGDNMMGKSRPGYGAHTVAVLGDGSVVVVGSTDADPIEIDDDSFPSQGGLDAIVVRVAHP